MPCSLTLAHPYVPDQNVPWVSVDLEDQEVSLAGDFVNKKLNTEQRRFAFRDAGSVFVAIGYVIIAGAGLAALAPGEDTFFVVVAFATTIALVCVAPVEIWAHVMASQVRYTTSVVRLVNGILLSLFALIAHTTRLHSDVTQCGDHDAIFSNNTNVSLPAREARQQYCIDVIEPYVAGGYVVIVQMFHLYPQHGIPLILLSLVSYFSGYALVPSESTERYTLRSESVTVGVIMHILFAGGSMILNIHVHRATRERFMAAARAERARQLAMAGLDEIDHVLRATLPGSVLERVARGTEVLDESDAVTVVYGDLVGFSVWSAEELAAADAATLLNTLVTGFDAIVARSPGVEKVKTIGDAYWAVVGLPDAVPCHASLACKAALEMQDLAQEVAKTRASWGSLRLQIGVGSGSARATILGTLRLCYEPFGEACDLAIGAQRAGLIGRVCITDSTRNLLIVDTQTYGHQAVEFGLIFESVDEATSQITHHGDMPLPSSSSPPPSGSTTTTGLHVLPMRNMQQQHARQRRKLRRGGGANPFVNLQGNEEMSTVHTSHNFSNSTAAIPSTEGATDTPRTENPAHSDEDVIELEVAEDEPASPADHGDNDAAEIVAMTQEMVDEQRAMLEQRIAFVRERAERQQTRARQRAKRAARRGVASVVSGAVRYQTSSPVLVSGGGADDVKDVPDEEDEAAMIALDPTIPTYDRMTSAEHNGPFARASCIPFVYTFAGEEAETNFIHFARAATYRMRRDCRIVMTLFLVAMFISLFIDANDSINIGAYIVLALGAIVSVINVVTLVNNVGPAGTDSVLSYLVCAMALVGGFLADGSTIGNDVSWIPRLPTLFVMLTIWTISPPIRAAIHLVLSTAALLKLYIIGAGAAQDHAVQAIASVFLMFAIVSALESFTRRAFVERFLADRLVRQEVAARHAQTAMLENVVPRHSITELAAWMATEFSPLHTSAAEHDIAAVAAIRLSSPAGAGPKWLLETHRIIDALLDRCLFVEKSKTCGDWLLLAGPFGPARTEHPEGALGATAAAISEALFVIKTLCLLGKSNITAGIHVGHITTAILGRDRPSFDIWGDAVASAERALTALPTLTIPTENAETVRTHHAAIAAANVRDVVRFLDSPQQQRVVLTESALAAAREHAEFEAATGSLRLKMPAVSKQSTALDTLDGASERSGSERDDSTVLTYGSGATFLTGAGTSEGVVIAKVRIVENPAVIKARADLNTGRRDKDLAVYFIEGVATEPSAPRAAAPGDVAAETGGNPQ